MKIKQIITPKRTGCMICGVTMEERKCIMIEARTPDGKYIHNNYSHIQCMDELISFRKPDPIIKDQEKEECGTCELLRANNDKLNEAIEEMFVFAFRCGFKTAAEHINNAINDKVAGCLESGLFPDLAKKWMREFFSNMPKATDSEKPIYFDDHDC